MDGVYIYAATLEIRRYEILPIGKAAVIIFENQLSL